MEDKNLRTLIRVMNVPVWKIADHIGVSEMTIYRWLRKCDEEHHATILKAVKELSGDDHE